MPELTTIQQIAVWIIPVLLAITLHEAAHAWVASLCGDTTAKQLGRLSFNPVKHIELFGTIILPIMILIFSNFHFVFGWAKPVPINTAQMPHPRRGMALSTAAGPLSNLLMAVIWTALFKLATFMHPETSYSALFLLLTSQAGILINLIFAFLNLLPIPPLDGSRILASLLPIRWAYRYFKIEPFGFVILLLLMVFNVLGWLLNPLITTALVVLKYSFNL